jgi:hypothetical protein
VKVKTQKAVAQIWSAMARTETVLAAFLERVARLADATSTTLRSKAIRARALSRGVPVGAALAGEEWQQPALLPIAGAVAPGHPPPIPADAIPRDAEEDRQWGERIARAKAAADDWNAVLAAAKERIGTEDEWGAAIVAAKRQDPGWRAPVVVAKRRPAPERHHPRR